MTGSVGGRGVQAGSALHCFPGPVHSSEEDLSLATPFIQEIKSAASAQASQGHEAGWTAGRKWGWCCQLETTHPY